MLAEKVKEVVEVLSKGLEENSLEHENCIFSIEKFTQILDEEKNRIIAFLDGGNVEVLKAPNFSVHFIRLYFNLFFKNKRKKINSMPQRIESFILINTIARDKYKMQFFELPYSNGERYTPNDEIFIKSNYDNRHREDISIIGSIGRRIAEFEFGRNVIKNELSSGDIIVLDGDLTTDGIEEKYFRKIVEEAKRKNVYLTALSKTSSLLTSKGSSLLEAVHSLSQKNFKNSQWFYPIMEDGEIKTFVCKLNGSSEYVFKFELLKEQYKEEELKEVFSLLSSNSKDLSLLGYPYGAIDAHKNAKITEAEVLRALFKFYIMNTKNSGTFKRAMNSLNLKEKFLD
ncbi:MAG: DNA double-strand break repair nuclease NurA [Candidatus Thermoplasmatota archaeon]